MLSPYADIVVSSRSHREGIVNARFAEIDTVLDSPVVIPSIPAQYFEEFFAEHGAMVNPDALVIDVCSVKVAPLAVLEKYLPSTCQLIGTHPMFGPASIRKNEGLAGLKCAYIPVRVDDTIAAALREFLEQTIGLRLITTTAAQHDKDMAYVQGLSHYIGRVMDIMDIPDSKFATYAYADLLDMKRIQGGDSWDLFMSIMNENPYAEEVRQQFTDACQTLDTKIADAL